MMVFKAHEHSKYVIMAGEQAIKCCNDRNNPILVRVDVRYYRILSLQ